MQNNRIKLINLIAGCLFACIAISCGSYSNRIESVLALAGDNRMELEKVLEHYRDSTLKWKAAEFLLTNMQGLFVPDTAVIKDYEPFYQQCDSVRKLYKEKEGGRWNNLVDSLWGEFNAKGIAGRVRYVPLLQTATAQQMIKEIDLAFCAWRENAYTRDCPFEEFCEYILPFYRGRNFVPDDSRSSFYKLHQGFFSQGNRPFDEVLDSLLLPYKAIVYSSFNGTGVTAISCDALAKVGGGSCIEKGTFNSALLSSLGVPITMDFVPHWGNKEQGHSWNVLIRNGKHYAFDPFLLHDDWIYNRLYANRGVYELFGQGEFRAPKIYRRTYSNHLETTLLDKGVALKDIPPLFQDFKKIDVSSEYFDSTDVEVSLTESMPVDAKYAYLCVWSLKGWIPLQFGKIENGKAVFKGMGRNIVYMPAFYEHGNLRPAAMPLLLKEDGKTQLLDGSGQTVDSLVIRNVILATYTNKRYSECLKGTSIIGLGQYGERDILCKISGMLSEKRTVYSVNCDSCVRFIRMNLPADSVALGELSFYTGKGKVKSPRILSALQPLSKEMPEAIFDNFTSTCFRGKVKDRCLDIDLGEECKLTGIVIVPYMASQIFENSTYELFYWKDGDWLSLEKQDGGKKIELVFRNVPGNGLFRLKQYTVKDRKFDERIFVYKDGEVLWM